jgi:hypothetical protein
MGNGDRFPVRITKCLETCSGIQWSLCRGIQRSLCCGNSFPASTTLLFNSCVYPVRTFNLEIRHRPIRLICLVDSLENLSNSVRFNLNLWGGRGNIIVPSPRTVKDVNSCRKLFERFRPDAFVYDSISVSKRGKTMIDSLPALSLDIGKHKYLSDFAEGTLEVAIGETYIRNLFKVHPDYKELTSVLDETISSHPIVRHAIAAKNGKHSYGGTGMRMLDLGYKVRLKDELQYAANNRLGLLGKDIQTSWPLASGNLIDGLDFLYLFVTASDNSDLHTLSSFWNSSIITSRNKLLVNKHDLSQHTHDILELLRNACPNVANLRIVMSGSRSEAEELQLNVISANGVASKLFNVDVIYADHVYSTGYHTLKVGKEIRETVTSHDTEILIPFPVPEWLRNSDTAFAVDVSIRESQRNFALPYTKPSSCILSCASDAIIHFKYDMRLAKHFSQETTILPSTNGLSFIASDIRASDRHTNKVKCYIPMGPDVVDLYLGLSGLMFDINAASQYAKALLVRLDDNGLANEYLLELDILNILRGGNNSALQLTYQQIEYYFNRLRSTTVEPTLLTTYLSNLIRLGMIKRGHDIQCPRCKMTEWYAITNTTEFAVCIGCGDQVLVPIDRQSKFRFKLTEIGLRLVTTGGRGVAQAVSVLRSNYTANVTEVGGDVTKDQAKFDVDAFRFTSSEFAIVECKDRADRINAKEVIQVAKTLIHKALKVGASTAYLFIGTRSPISESLLQKVCVFYSQAEKQGVRFYLLVNSDIYIEKGAMLAAHKFDTVRYEAVPSPPMVVGKYFRNHGFGDFNNYYNVDFVNAL